MTVRKIFLAYRFTGEHVSQVKQRLDALGRLLRQRGYQVFSLAEDVRGWKFEGPDALSWTEVADRGLALMNRCDALLAIFNDGQASEGRGFEIGYFHARGKPTILAMRSRCHPLIERMTAQSDANVGTDIPSVIRFSRFEEIAAQFPSLVRVKLGASHGGRAKLGTNHRSLTGQGAKKKPKAKRQGPGAKANAVTKPACSPFIM
ncbi:MAG: nucleoside 2-deoxyribosyltransferase [Patescibacteria group bacterium]|nr:nucleoside 2-deoxyribosyltransferase [Patescibacteria group bacterium]